MIEPKQFSESIYSMRGISKKTIEDHLKLYAGYVNKYNEITEKLQGLSEDDFIKSNQVFSTLRSLKTELSFAWGGIINHEIYFTHLGGVGGSPTGDVMTQIAKDFGSFDNFKKDMKATAIAARGWAWTVWNFREKKLMNHLGDSQNTYALWWTKPLIALDTYEHAYFADYGVNRGQYIDSFFEHVDWSVIEKSFSEIKK